jgi:hypothetical protein
VAETAEGSITLASSWFGATPVALQDAIVGILTGAGGTHATALDLGSITVVLDRRAADSLRREGVVVKNQRRVTVNRSMVADNAEHVSVARAWLAATRAMISARTAA